MSESNHIEDQNEIFEDYQNAIIMGRDDDKAIKEKNTEHLLFLSHHKRIAVYLAHVLSSASLSDSASHHMNREKMKLYTSMIDDRNGVNNFASLVKHIGLKHTNVSKTWKSGLREEDIDLWLDEMLATVRKEQTTNDPTPQDLAVFFASLCKRRSEEATTAVINLPCSSHHQDEGIKKKSLYSTYKDNYLDMIVDKFSSTSNAEHGTSDISASSHVRQQQNLGKRLFSSVSSRNEKMDVDRVGEESGRSDKKYNKHDIISKTSSDRIKKLNSFLKEGEEEERKQLDIFRTASETLKIQRDVKGNKQSCQGTGLKKSLGGKGRTASNRFVPPLRSSQDEDSDGFNRKSSSMWSREDADKMPEEDERLRHIDPKMVEMIRSEIMDHGSQTNWSDIAGLEFAKHTIQEIVVWPMLRPDIFTGLRRPPKGILLFGPPGTGKTLIGKCIASQSKSTFFSISASSLTSKWIGDGEKMVRALFAVARVEQPSVVFIDEIDSLLSQRSDQEHESSRRIKTEFLVQLDGAATGEEDRLLIIGATNRPQELDEAARRRLVKRLYIPLPDLQARIQLVSNLMSKEKNDMSEEDMKEVAKLTDGYSGADMKNLCQEASLGPIRSISASLIASIDPQQVRPVNVDDFKAALKRVRSSVSAKDLDLYIEWDRQFGMSS